MISFLLLPLQQPMAFPLLVLYSSLTFTPLATHTSGRVGVLCDTITPKKIIAVPYEKIVTPQDTADSEAQFPGGQKALLTFIYRHLDYPDEAVSDSIEGTMSVRFMVQKDGKVGNITIIKSLHKACDDAVVKVIRALPRFIPAKKKGKPIASAYLVPIRFRLN